MTDAIEAVNDNTLSLSSIIMSGSLPPHPAQRQRRATVLRRSSSAPNVRTPINSGSTSAASGEAGTSTLTLSSRSRSSYSHPVWRSYDFQPPPRPRVSPWASVYDREHDREHDRERSRRATSEPPAAPAPTPRLDHDEDISQNMEVMTRRLEEIRRNLSMRQRRTNRVTLGHLWVALRGLFGYGPEGTAARRESVSLAGKLLFGAGQACSIHTYLTAFDITRPSDQIATTITLLCIGANNRRPENGNLNEWQACERPLGAWCSMWCVRVLLGCIMAVWGYRRKAERIAEATE